MKIGNVVPVGIALLTLSGGLRAASDCKPTGTTVQKTNCVVTNGFVKKHLANRREDAVRQTISRGERSTFIQMTDDNLLKLRDAADRSGRSRPKDLRVWECAPVESKKKGGDASCGESVTRTLYFCSKVFPPASQNMIYHLDSNSSAACVAPAADEK